MLYFGFAYPAYYPVGGADDSIYVGDDLAQCAKLCVESIRDNYDLAHIAVIEEGFLEIVAAYNIDQEHKWSAPFPDSDQPPLIDIPQE